MLRFSRSAALMAAVVGGLAMQSVRASAVPMVDINPAVVAHSEGVSGVQDAYWYFYHPHYYHRRYFVHRYYWHRPYYWHRRHYWHPFFF